MARTFDAPVLRTEAGMINHYLPVPDDIAGELLAGGHRRVIATINGRQYRRALTGRGDGSFCLIVGESLLRAA